MLLASTAAIFGVSILTVAAFGAGFWVEKRLPASFSALERAVISMPGAFGYVLASVVSDRTNCIHAQSNRCCGHGVGCACRSALWRLLQAQPTSWKVRIDPIAGAVIAIVLL